MKRERIMGLFQRHVAPRAGAWIETVDLLAELKLKAVAPRAGAWIETPQSH